MTSTCQGQEIERNNASTGRDNQVWHPESHRGEAMLLFSGGVMRTFPAGFNSRPYLCSAPSHGL